MTVLKFKRSGGEPRRNGWAKPNRKAGRFILVPVDWLDRLDAIEGRSACAERLLYRLLRVSWERGEQTVVCSNVTFGGLGVTRNTRARALRQLATAGLVLVEWHPRKAPVVQILYPEGHPALQHCTKSRRTRSGSAAWR